MSNVKQNVINIVMGLPPVEPEVTVAVPAEMTVEQAREVLSNPLQLSTSVKEMPTPEPSEVLRSLMDDVMKVVNLVDSYTAHPVVHPEPSEDPTGYSGFSGETKGIETGDLTYILADKKQGVSKPYIKFKMVSDGIGGLYPMFYSSYSVVMPFFQAWNEGKFPKIVLS